MQIKAEFKNIDLHFFWLDIYILYQTQWTNSYLIRATLVKFIGACLEVSGDDYSHGAFILHSDFVIRTMREYKTTAYITPGNDTANIHKRN